MKSEDPNTNGSPLERFNPLSSVSLEQYYRERLANVRQKLPEVARQLRDAGVTRVEVYYDGCGDSGQIETIHYFDAVYKAIDLSGQVTITDDELTDLFYDLLETRHAGWEINDGAFGEFDWDLIADTLKHAHSERFVECETTEHEGL